MQPNTPAFGDLLRLARKSRNAHELIPGTGNALFTPMRRFVHEAIAKDPKRRENQIAGDWLALEVNALHLEDPAYTELRQSTISRAESGQRQKSITREIVDDICDVLCVTEKGRRMMLAAWERDRAATDPLSGLQTSVESIQYQTSSKGAIATTLARVDVATDKSQVVVTTTHERMSQVEARLGNTSNAVAEVGTKVSDVAGRLEATAGDTTARLDKVRTELGQTRRAVDDVGSRISRVADQVEKNLKHVELVFKLTAGPVFVATPVGVLGRSFQRFLYSMIYLSAVSAFFIFTGSTNAFMISLFLFGGFAVAFLLGIPRVLPFGGHRGDEESSPPLPWIADLLFLSLLVVLSSQLFQASMTKIDVYGFFTQPALEGTYIPIIAALAVNVMLAVIAVGLFQAVGSRIYQGSSTSAFARALWTAGPAFLVAYIPAAIFGVVGFESGLLMSTAPLFAAVLIMLIVTDPSVRMAEPDAKLLRHGILFTIAILFIVASIAIVINFLFLQNGIPGGTHVESWVIDFSTLGYTAEEFAAKNAYGFLWGILFTMFYLLVVVGSNLFMTVHRYQVTPFRR